MTIKEATTFMERIKQHYQDFIIDEYKIKEWYKDLQYYNFDEVNKKLDEHLRSEKYGEYIPKLHFLLMYLVKEEDKDKDWLLEKNVRCGMCGKIMNYYDYEEHYKRHSSIEYIKQQYLKYKNEEIDTEKLFNMDNAEFNKKYDKILEFVLENTEDKEEKERIEKYFIGRGY